MNESAGQKLWKRRAQTALGNRRSDFHFSHSFNNNKLDDRNHFLQNAKTSVASLRRLITPTRNADHDQPGTLIIFIGIRTTPCNLLSPSFSAICFAIGAISRILRYSLVTAGPFRRIHFDDYQVIPTSGLLLSWRHRGALDVARTKLGSASGKRCI